MISFSNTQRRLSDVSEGRASAERTSAERARTSDSSMSEHELEMQEVRIVPAPTEPVPDNPLPTPFARQNAFESFRKTMEPHGRRQPYRSSFEKSMQSMQSADSIPLGEDPAQFVVQHTLNAAAPAAPSNSGGVGASSRNSSIPPRVRVSLDIDPSKVTPNSVIHGSVVRRRRRLPWKLLLTFGIVSCCALLVGLCTLSIGIYNFTKLKAGRAAKTIDQFSKEITPMILAIYNKVNETRR